jgi:hypothetical protein
MLPGAIAIAIALPIAGIMRLFGYKGEIDLGEIAGMIIAIGLTALFVLPLVYVIVLLLYRSLFNH